MSTGVRALTRAPVGTRPDTTAAAPPDLLVARVRLALQLGVVSTTGFAVADAILLHPHLGTLYLIKAVQVALIATLWRLLNGPRRTDPVLVGSVAVASYYLTSALSGVVVGDSTTTGVLVVVCAVGTAVLLPWGIRAQLASALVGMLLLLGNVMLVHGHVGGVRAYPNVMLAVAAGASVWLAHALARHERTRARLEAERETSHRLLEAIHRIQSRFIAEAEPRVVYEELLASLLAATGSAYGFVGEVHTDPDGQPYLKTVAITNIAWDEDTRALYDRLAEGGLAFRNLRTLFGAVLTTGQPVIANTPATDPRAGGLPPAHPSLDAFLGVPLHHGANLVGMAGIANRAGGYDARLVEWLQPLLTTAAAIVEAHAHVRERWRAEAERTEAAAVSAALARVGEVLISSLDAPMLLERLCRVAGEVLECDVSCTFLQQPAEDVFLPVAGAGTAGAGGLPALRFPRARMARFLARLTTDTVVEIPDAPTAVGPRPRLCMALRRGDEVIGVQVVGCRDGGAPFSDQQRRIAHGVAQLASMVLAHARLVEEVAQVSRLKTQFVSTMSHELRTPLHVMLGYAELAADDGMGTAERREALAKVEAAGQQLLELIESTLAVGQIEAGRDAPAVEQVALDSFWRMLGDGCAQLRRPDAVTLEWAQEVPAVTLLTDAKKLTAIVRNLVGNALKFTPAGRVAVTAALDGDTLVVRVADTGIGIRPESQEAIFEMFRQGDQSDTRRFEGTGVGLYLVRRFAEQLGGTVTVDSAPGRGSEFVVRVPAGSSVSARA